MKKTLLILSAVATMSSFAETVAYWKFGSTGLADSSGKGNDLVLSGSGGSRLGKDGQCVFDGTKRDMWSMNQFNFQNGYTIEFFVRMAEPRNSGIIVELSPNYGNNLGCGLIDLESGKLTSAYRPTSTTYNLKEADSDALLDGLWHHVALVVDPAKAATSEVAAMYVDGVIQNDGAYKGAGFVAMGSAQYLYLGQRSGGTLPFVGEIDDVRVSDGPLAPADFLTARSAERAPGTTVAHWTFDGSGDDAWRDVSGNGNDLVVAGVTRGDDGQAVFDKNQTGCNSKAALDFAGLNNGYTVECFVRMATDLAGTAAVAELGPNFATGTQSEGCFLLDVNDSVSGGMTATYHNNSYNMRHTAANAMKDDKWHRVALVVDKSKAGTGNVTSFYFDSNPMPNVSGYVANEFRMAPDLQFYLGLRNNKELKFKGEVDNVRISAAPLSSDQFLKDRSDVDPGAESENVFDLNGVDGEIVVAAGETLFYDRILTRSDDPGLVLTKKGAGTLVVRSPFAGVWDIAEGKVVLPAGDMPALKKVAGRKLMLKPTTLTAVSGGDADSFILTAESHDALRPRLASKSVVGAFPVAVKLQGTAKLTLSAETVHGEVGLSTGEGGGSTDLLAAKPMTLGYGEELTESVSIPADGFYHLRLLLRSTKTSVGGYELRVNGKIRSFGRVDGVTDVIRSCPLGYFKKDETIEVSLMSTSGNLGTSDVPVLQVCELALDMPAMQGLPGYDAVAMDLTGTSGLVLDYAGVIHLGRLCVNGIRQRGTVSAATHPDFLSSAGTLSIGHGLFIVVQ